jgi:hypothetical protein
LVPWDDGAGVWRGSFPGEATEVVRLTGGGQGRGGQGLYRKVPECLGKKRRKRGIDAEREAGKRWLDMNDGHVLGRDWACGTDGPVMALYVSRDADGDAEKEACGDAELGQAVEVAKRVKLSQNDR